ncbi:MAG: response regulator transcription factor [Chloroflexi bacterium]|nr:response regulator transcription factor [Chloroflexota bacterium]MBP7044000.1 response regulator transcription factor [Chloroflexota bacterium]
MKLLVVEDDLALSDVVDFTLRRAGFDVVRAYDGLTAVTLWEQEAPDLILLDLNLPRLDGLAVCRQIRSQGDTPIIILSVRGGDEAVVQGLELGADDYIVKPFSPTQLVARVRALLRRAGATPTAVMLETAVFTLDRSRSELRLPGQDPIRLTPLESRLLETLMHNAGQVLTAETLISAIWGAEGGDRAMLKQLVYRLRAKIEPDPSQPTYLETIPGVGYALRQER